ncbi:LOW QUALITY PROTEIN: 2-hydroxychromene-2-carboxylate isomerase/DsbA-like thioredoxin domain [Geomicrobium sp. JCM 19039]|nr:LOW QUALITY PROTEIN: 2-hydroxychromene-2-carboxylate isomerase/DsbA-like thioredoxin domain [Geomicrobium sp. JCM 19039]
MNVEVWSDIACPFCYIGKRKFEMALEDFEGKNDVNVTFKSFQLEPDAPKHSVESMNEKLAKKYGKSVDEMEAMQQQVAAQAKEVGLDYRLDLVQSTNTEAAHRLTHYAKEHGRNELTEKLLQAYFIEGKHIGEEQELVRLAEEVGLKKEAVQNVLASGAYKEAVQQDIREGAELGVQGVPFFVFNRKYAVSGAQPPAAFLEVLNKVKAEEKPSPLNVVKQGDACSDETC